MSKQFEHLKLLYDQILRTSQEVKRLVDRENFDDAVFREAHKAQLINKVVFLRKQVKLTDEEAEILDNIEKEILESEQRNIELLMKLKDEVALKLQEENSKQKVVDKYAPDIPPQGGSIIDFSTED